MRMLVAALIGGALLGFLGAKFLGPQVGKLSADPGIQLILSAGVVAFLGSLWGWVAKGLVGSRPRQ
jgi:hypothetical protein